MRIIDHENLAAMLARTAQSVPLPTGDEEQSQPLVAVLNHLLTQELMAAEACRNAASWFEHLPVAHVLREVMAGHHQRAGLLFIAIREEDGQPVVDPRFQQDPMEKPDPIDAREVMALLLDLEQRGVAAYHQATHHLAGAPRIAIEADLLPAQERALASIAGVQPPAPDGAV